MSLVTRSNGQAAIAPRARDPFQVARDLLGWDPFFGARQVSAFVPAFEVKETNEAFILKADIPGVAEPDLDIAVHNNILTVSGSRKAEDRQDGEAFALYERQYGSFSRSFALPETADGERVEAKPRKIALRKQ